MNLRDAIQKVVEEYSEKGLSLKTKIVTQELGIRLFNYNSQVWMVDFKNQLKLNLLSCILKEEQYFINSEDVNFATLDLVSLINKYYANDEALLATKEYILNTNFLSDMVDDHDSYTNENTAVLLFSETLDTTLLKRTLHLWDTVKFSQYAKKDKVVEMPTKNLDFHNSNDIIQGEVTEKTMEQSDIYESSKTSVR